MRAPTATTGRPAMTRLELSASVASGERARRHAAERQTTRNPQVDVAEEPLPFA